MRRGPALEGNNEGVRLEQEEAGQAVGDWGQPGHNLQGMARRTENIDYWEYTCIPTMMAIMKRAENNKCWQGGDGTRTFLH